ncbi:hypothetical protein [Croceimicrobium sp.]|uniref:hypothetical protein n=1 Tax=Croceimicrobium sp. TaxID=2828340 RepID=UPI003BA8B277
MKFWFTLSFLSLSLPSYGQNHSFSDLFQSVNSICWETEAEIIKAQAAGTLSEKQSDSLINRWELFCGSTEASIRSRLLHDLKYQGKLDTLIPLEYWRVYFKNLEGDSYLSVDLQKHLEWSKGEAWQLLYSREWPKYERKVLEILAADDMQEVYDQMMRMETYNDPEFEKLSQLVKDEAQPEDISFGLAYNYFYLNQDLKDNLGALHGASLLLDYQTEKFGFSLQTGFAASEQKAYLRFVEDGNLTESDLEVLFHIEAYLQYAVINSRRSRLRFGAGLGYNSFSTDLSNYDEELDQENPIGIGSFYPSIGLDYSYRLHGTRRLGLAAQYHLTDYNGNDELRSALSGHMLACSLYLSF